MGNATLLLLLVIGIIAASIWSYQARKGRLAEALADAREEAQRWHERLGGQVMSLNPGENEAARQALADASERYTASGGQLERATTIRQYELAAQTALEGLYYIRAARLALGLDPGPELPLTEAQRRNGVITAEREATVQGQHLKVGPQYTPDTPYYYPGGMMHGRRVPAGYYSQPWWRGALTAGVGALGAMMLFDALFVPDIPMGGFDTGGDFGGDFGDSGGFGDFGDFGDF